MVWLPTLCCWHLNWIRAGILAQGAAPPLQRGTASRLVDFLLHAPFLDHPRSHCMAVPITSIHHHSCIQPSIRPSMRRCEFQSHRSFVATAGKIVSVPASCECASFRFVPEQKCGSSRQTLPGMLKHVGNRNAADLDNRKSIQSSTWTAGD